MPLVIETGEGVEDATCYGITNAAATRAAARAYAADRGITLPADDDALDVFLFNGMDFIEQFADQFVGTLVDVDQSLSWPRKDVLKSDGSAFPENELPAALLKALWQLCIEQNNGIVLSPSIDPANGGFVTVDKVDVIETHYSEKIGTSRKPSMPKFDALIATLLSTTKPALTTVRI